MENTENQNNPCQIAHILGGMRILRRGFITLATGDKNYYRLAANLLRSYRQKSYNPMPFAIIAEEENEFTALFDDVIITKEAMHNYCDKFLLLKLAPYDENIFLDTDIVAFEDLNQWWEEFENASDFSSSGVNSYPPYSQNDGTWYDIKDLGEYGNKLAYKCRVHAGVLFLRTAGEGKNRLHKLYEVCMDLYNHYSELYFHSYAWCMDECILGVAMPMNNMRTIEEKKELFGFYPFLTSVKANYIKGKINYIRGPVFSERCATLHFGTVNTYKPLYLYCEKCINYIEKNKKSIIGEILYKERVYYFYLLIKDLFDNRFKKVFRKIKRIIQALCHNGK